MTAQSTFIENFGRFERIGSTFTHKILCGNGKTLYGHSKPVNQAEKENKQELLKDIILRIVKSETGKNAQRIDFYRNKSNNDSESVKLFSLYPNRYEPEAIILKETWLLDILKAVYTPAQTLYNNVSLFPTSGPSAIEVAAVFPPSIKQCNLDNYDQYFKTLEEVINYTQKAKAEGWPEGAILNWYKKHTEKYPFRYKH